MSGLWISPDDLEDSTSIYAEDAAKAASSILYALSGRKYGGIRQVEELYRCATYRSAGYLSGSTLPTGIPEIWEGPTVALSHDGMTCGCNRRLRLRGQPVRSIVSMTTSASSTIGASTYRLIDNSYVEFLTPVDMSDCGGVIITYRYGAAPPAAGVFAAKVLANELVKSRDCPEECQLPQRVTSVSRQGVSFTVLDPQDFLDKGFVGVYEIDLFLQSVNPGKAKVRPRVFSPDLPYGSRIR